MGEAGAAGRTLEVSKRADTWHALSEASKGPSAPTVAGSFVASLFCPGFFVSKDSEGGDLNGLANFPPLEVAIKVDRGQSRACV